MLDIKNLHVQIDDKKILKGLNLHINPGEIHVLMGINGTGKSTLVKAISAHYDCLIKEGSITYKNSDLLQFDATKRANEGIFMSFQNPVEIPGVSNMYFLKTALNEKKKYHGEEELNAASFLKLIKNKTDTFNLDDKVLKRNLNEGFSGGEKKRNEALQLLILDPVLSVLDETDSGLDIDALRVVANGINKLKNDDNALILITHYQRILNYMQPDFVHVLMNGKLVKSGTKELAKELEEKGYSWIEEEMTEVT